MMIGDDDNSFYVGPPTHNTHTVTMATVYAKKCSHIRLRRSARG